MEGAPTEIDPPDMVEPGVGLFELPPPPAANAAPAATAAPATARITISFVWLALFAGSALV